MRRARLLELLSAFNQKLSEISGDRMRIYLVNPGDSTEGSPGASGLHLAGLRAKRLDREGCR